MPGLRASWRPNPGYHYVPNRYTDTLRPRLRHTQIWMVDDRGVLSQPLFPTVRTRNKSVSWA